MNTRHITLKVLVVALLVPTCAQSMSAKTKFNSLAAGLAASLLYNMYLHYQLSSITNEKTQKGLEAVTKDSFQKNLEIMADPALKTAVDAMRSPGFQQALKDLNNPKLQEAIAAYIKAKDDLVHGKAGFNLAASMVALNATMRDLQYAVNALKTTGADATSNIRYLQDRVSGLNHLVATLRHEVNHHAHPGLATTLADLGKQLSTLNSDLQTLAVKRVPDIEARLSTVEKQPANALPAIVANQNKQLEGRVATLESKLATVKA